MPRIGERDEKSTVVELLRVIKARASQAPRKLLGPFQNVSLVTEVERRYIIKFFMEEGMKRVEIIKSLSKHDDWGALDRTQVYYWIKEMKSGKNASNNPPSGRAPNEELNECIGKALKEDPHFSARKIAKGLKLVPRRCKTIWPKLWDWNVTACDGCSTR